MGARMLSIAQLVKESRAIEELVRQWMSFWRIHGLIGHSDLLVDETGAAYEVPKAEHIRAIMCSMARDLEPKELQGFDSLRLFPLAVSINKVLIALTKAVEYRTRTMLVSDRLRNAHGEHIIPSQIAIVSNDWGTRPFLYETDGYWVDRQTFLQRRTFPGWQVVLVRELDRWLPRAGEGQTIHDRSDVESGQTMAAAELKLSAPEYVGEVPLSPEALILECLYSVAADGLVPYFWSHSEGAGAYSLSCRINDAGSRNDRCPTVTWDSAKKRFHLSWISAQNRNSGFAPVTGVEIS